MFFLLFSIFMFFLYLVVSITTKLELNRYSKLFSKAELYLEEEDKKNFLSIFSITLETHRQSLFLSFVFGMAILAIIHGTSLSLLSMFLLLISMLLISLHISYYTKLSFYASLEQNNLSSLPLEKKEYPYATKKAIKVKAILTKYSAIISTAALLWATFSK